MMAYIFLSAQVSMQWRLCPGSLDWLHDWILKFLNLEFPAKKCFLFWLHIKRVVKCTLHFQFRSTLKYKFTIQNKIINAHIFAVKFVHLFFFITGSRKQCQTYPLVFCKYLCTGFLLESWRNPWTHSTLAVHWKLQVHLLQRQMGLLVSFAHL